MKNNERLLRLEEVSYKVGISQSCIRSKMKKGEFPQCIHISSTQVAWLESEINEWIQEKVQEREEKLKKGKNSNDK